MRLIDADELMEHVWRDKLDSRELIAKMIETAPTVKEIPTSIPINVFEKLISTGYWIPLGNYNNYGEESSYKCSECGDLDTYPDNYCHNCGARMIEKQESKKWKLDILNKMEQEFDKDWDKPYESEVNNG